MIFTRSHQHLAVSLSLCMCVLSCRKHYREYLVSLINGHALDPALLYDRDELVRACQRYQVEHQRADNEDDNAYSERLLKVRRRSEQAGPLGLLLTPVRFFMELKSVTSHK